MQFFIDHSTYAALAVATMVMVGILVYLARIDARLRRVESGLDAFDRSTR